MNILETFKGLRTLVEEFIKRAPAFEEDRTLAGAIGRAMADLEYSLYPPVNSFYPLRGSSSVETEWNKTESRWEIRVADENGTVFRGFTKYEPSLRPR